MDLISVIIPIYNVQPYLERCVESVRNQTYSNLEIILVDDESPGDCPKMCDEYAKKDSRIKVIHKKNGGLGYARNSGLELVHGKYVMFIDSDDWISDTRVEVLYNAITKAEADIAIGSFTDVDSDNNRVEYHSSLSDKEYVGDEIIKKILLPMVGPDPDYKYDVQINCCVWRCMYKTDVIFDNKLWFISERDAISEDMFFNIDFLYHAKRAVCVTDCGHYYFKNLQSISRKYDPKGFARTLSYYSSISEKLENYGLSDESKLRVERTFLMMVRVSLKQIVNSDMKKKEKLSLIKSILSQKTIESVLCHYPIDTYMPFMSFFVKLMKKKRVRMVYFIINIRNIAGNQSLPKKILRAFGIGKHF